jgi:hypothetical protein
MLFHAWLPLAAQVRAFRDLQIPKAWCRDERTIAVLARPVNA